MIKSEIVAHSLSPQKEELISVLATFPRIILAEVNTHRMLSKNTSSSRAIPFNKMVEVVQTNPFIPIAWQKEHTGMQGYEYIIDEELINQCRLNWLGAKDKAIQFAKDANYNLQVTKQLCNRLLEPFMWTTMLITGSREGWNNFFNLRCPIYNAFGNNFKSKKECIKKYPANSNLTDLDWLQENKGMAEIHMMQLAETIWDSVNENTPKQLKAGQWHIPFENKILEMIETDLMNAVQTNRPIEEFVRNKSDMSIVKVSVAMAARTSYTIVGKEKEINYEKMIELHDKLLIQDPPHCFTENTEILTNEGWKFFENLTKEELIASVDIRDGKFIGFEKPISYIEDNYEGKIYTYKTKNVDISVTPNHKLLGISVSKSSDRSRSYGTLEIIEPQQKISDIKTLGERELIMFSAPKPTVIDDLKMYKEGQLLGFFLGDGSARYKNSIRFRLKKERKKSYIVNLLKDLGIDYTITLDSNNIYNIKADIGDYTIYYDEDYNKRIPENILLSVVNHVDFIAGLFDGLKNSDGSVKRNTWVYDTFSTPLKENILFLCPLIGLTGIENPSYKHHRISFLTTNRILLNDSRKPESKVLIEDYKGKIYCVETPSHGIIVRKNGKVLITHNSSPMEHCARAMSDKEYDTHLKGVIKDRRQIGDLTKQQVKEIGGWCRNFKGFIPYRYIIETK